MIINHHHTLIFNLIAAMKVLEHTIPSNTEPGLHDLTKPEESVVFIINGGISDRKIDSPLQSGPDDDIGFLETLFERHPPFSHML